MFSAFIWIEKVQIRCNRVMTTTSKLEARTSAARDHASDENEREVGRVDGADDPEVESDTERTTVAR